MDIHALTALTHPYVSNMDKTTFHLRAQNHQIYQQNTASVQEPIQPTTRDAQHIKQFTGSATTTTQAKKPSSLHPLISTPTPILNNNNNQALKTRPGYVRMQM